MRMGAANVREYLDRGLENQEFLASFPNTTVTYLPQTRSDHHPICVRDREGLNQLSLEKPFRMLDVWFTHPSFEKLVKESWCTSKRAIDIMQNFRSKANFWNMFKFDNIFDRNLRCKARLGVFRKHV